MVERTSYKGVKRIRTPSGVLGDKSCIFGAKFVKLGRGTILQLVCLVDMFAKNVNVIITIQRIKRGNLLL